MEDFVTSRHHVCYASKIAASYHDSKPNFSSRAYTIFVAEFGQSVGIKLEKLPTMNLISSTVAL